MAKDPFRAVDDEARGLALRLAREARHGALGVLDPSGSPFVSRVAVSMGPLAAGPAMLMLLSDLSAHTSALRADGRASILVGEPGAKGDPLTHPRLTLIGRAAQVDKAEHRALWLSDHPKAALYIDFSDFGMFRLEIAEAHLNGGFGKAWRLGPSEFWPDLA